MNTYMLQGFKNEFEKTARRYHIPKEIKDPIKNKYLKKVVDYANENPYKTLAGGTAAVAGPSMGYASQKAEDGEIKKFLKDYVVDTTAGGISGAGVALITQPLDTKTIRQQAGSKAKGAPFSGLSGRLKKTMIAGAIGYPLFTGAQSLINRKKEKELTKQAFVGPAALGLTRAFKTLSKFTKPAKNFWAGMTGATKTPAKQVFTTKSGLAGTATSLGAFSAYSPPKVSKLDSAMKAQAKLKLPNTPSFNSFT